MAILKIKLFAFAFYICTITLALNIQNVWGKVGISYSPFVREEDRSFSAAYTRNDVKVMLKLVEEQGYHEIFTYGVGSPSSEEYVRNETWKRSASVVHTALAAAEINLEKKAQALTVFQGLHVVQGSTEKHINTEINVGFEVASMANNIYPGSVSGIILPSSAGTHELINDKVFHAMEEVSARSRSMNLKYGARLWDCTNLVNYMDNASIKRLLGMMNFLICLIYPLKEDLRLGPDLFFNRVKDDIANTQNAIRNIEPSSYIHVYLETGWPGGENLGEPNSDIKAMIKFWNLIRNNEGTQQIIMHEAFNNPWKREVPSILLGPHYGRWRHKQVKGDNSRNAYELKTEKLEKPAENGGVSKELIIGVVFGLALFIVLIAVIFLVYKRVSQKIKAGGRLTQEEIRQFLDGVYANEKIDDSGNTDAWNKVPYNKEFELQKNKFTIEKDILLGSGAFGFVYKGKIVGLVNEVAFKTTRPDCPLTALKGLLSEIKILTYLGKHENLVSVCGAYTAELTNGVVYLATELCPNGSLEKYLRKNKSNYVSIDNPERYVNSPQEGFSETTNEITDLRLIQWSLEIASAMEYISSKNVIHADLATRNVLLSSNLIAKVTDFGLSRRLYEYTEYVKKQQEPLPWRWMAVESLKQLEFSRSSDVWSYGILLWEIYSLGDVPYPGLSWNVNFVYQLENGLRMQKPTRGSVELYEIMLSCWNTDPNCRPSFEAIKESLLSVEKELKK